MIHGSEGTRIVVHVLKYFQHPRLAQPLSSVEYLHVRLVPSSYFRLALR